MLDFSLTILVFIFATGFIAGFIDTLVGGGGLLTIPVLNLMGLPLPLALGTNKLQSSFGTFSASWTLYRKGNLPLKRLIFPFICTFCASFLGALLIQKLDPSFLKILIPILLIGIALLFLFFPNIGSFQGKQRLSWTAFALIIGVSIGFYDGFFGPGTGSFFAIAFILLLGLPLKEATMNTKVLNFASNSAALLAFSIGGFIVWKIGIVMGLGQILGAWLGAHTVLHKGSALIKPLLIGMSLILSLKLLFF